MNTFDEIYKAVKKVPKGKVTTYGTIANYIGIKNPRVVGYALHANSTPDTVPCHRVVDKHGGLAKGYAFGGLEIQKKLLVSEGIKFENENVDLSKYFFKFNTQ